MPASLHRASAQTVLPKAHIRAAWLIVALVVLFLLAFLALRTMTGKERSSTAPTDHPAAAAPVTS